MESRNSKPMNALSEILAVTTSLTDPSKNESLDPKVFDKDRQQWLREAFENNLEDIPKKILNYLKELTEINDKKKFDEKDRIKFIFEDLREMCYNFDSARDFYKMGGFQKLDPYIFSSIIDFRIYSIDCLSTILQNNIELQTATILNLIVHSESNKMLRNFIEKLLEFLNDENFRKNLIDFQQKHFKY
ncbi:hypothetical protein HZS_5957 [Henneguya salminicola]|nr:hypothetical protein HZS_5957 [Henneguya salminicola]